MSNVTALPIMKMKTCTKCQTEKSIDNFDLDRSHKSGYRSQCKTCRSAARAAASGKSSSASQKMTPEQAKKHEANRAAILRLIENHRSEFNNLVYSEQIRAGLITPGDRVNVPKWMSLA